MALLDVNGNDLKPTWKPHEKNQLEIQLPLKDVAAGPLQLAVTQYGQANPDLLHLRAYSDAVHLERGTDCIKVAAAHARNGVDFLRTRDGRFGDATKLGEILH